MGAVIVRKGSAKPLWRGHPWVYRDSIESVDGSPEDGDLVSVRDCSGRPIGCGFLSRNSRIAVRILSGEEAAECDAAFFRARVERALALREETLGLPVMTNAYRVVHSEGDFLPGLVVDRFADVLAVQFSTVGMHRRKEAILDALEELLSPRAIYETPDRKAAELEGLPAEGGLLRGSALKQPVSILENGVTFRVGIGLGQKTGFFTDQRDNRRLLGSLARDRSVLDLHTYTGGFGLYAAVNGASEVYAIDSSGPALAVAVENAMLNNVRQVRFERADAQETLNRLHAEGRKFDIVVSDPPRFARTRQAVPAALRAYRDLHLRAIRVVETGGLFAAASCSGLIAEGSFEKTLREAAHDVGRSLQILRSSGQAPDHPVLATCIEGRYLKFVLSCVR